MATIDAICERWDVTSQTVKGWIAGLERHERDEAVERWSQVMKELRWLDRDLFEPIAQEMERLTAHARAVYEKRRDSECALRRLAYERACEAEKERERRRAGHPFTVIDGGAA